MIRLENGMKFSHCFRIHCLNIIYSFINIYPHFLRTSYSFHFLSHPLDISFHFRLMHLNKGTNPLNGPSNFPFLSLSLSPSISHFLWSTIAKFISSSTNSFLSSFPTLFLFPSFPLSFSPFDGQWKRTFGSSILNTITHLPQWFLQSTNKYPRFFHNSHY